MKKSFFNSFSLSVVILTAMTGCSTGHDYWTNRRDDAKDIIACTIGGGWGVKVQAGPVFADSIYNYAPIYGLCGGETLPGLIEHSADYHISEGNIGFPLPCFNQEIFYPGQHAAKRGKAYCANTPLLPFFILVPNAHSIWYDNHCLWKRKSALFKAQREKFAKLPKGEREKYKYENAPLTETEAKTLNEKLDKINPPQLPFDGWRAWYKYSSIEITASFIGGFSIGFNPGELLDFLTGFVCLDIYQDDL